MCPSLGLKSDSFHYSHKYVFFFIAAISSLEMTVMWNLLRSHFSLLTTKTFLTGFSKNGREWVLPFPFHSNTGQPPDWKPLRRLSLIPKGGAVVRVDKLQNPPLPENLWHCFLKPPYHHDLGCNSSNSLTPGLLKQLPSWLFRLCLPVQSVSTEQGDHPPKLPSPVMLFLDLPQLALASHTHLIHLCLMFHDLDSLSKLSFCFSQSKHFPDSQTNHASSSLPILCFLSIPLVKYGPCPPYFSGPSHWFQYNKQIFIEFLPPKHKTSLGTIFCSCGKATRTQN